jgi:hypothetical protein
VVSQSLGAQLTLPRLTHAPAPSQVLGFCDFFFAMQLAGAQTVSAG